MGSWIFISALVFVAAVILACGSVVATNEVARFAFDMIAVLAGMVCVGLGEGA